MADNVVYKLNAGKTSVLTISLSATTTPTASIRYESTQVGAGSYAKNAIGALATGIRR